MEQENLSYEQQKKMELYEHDADFAHVMASRLNQLIDDKALTVEDVGKAPHDILDEFLCYFSDQIIDGDFLPYSKDKIKRFFNGESTGRIDAKKGPVGEQYVSMMKELLEEVKKGSSNIKGMILFGSRMGNYADSESDCDFKPILGNLPRNSLLDYESIGSFYSVLTKIGNKLCRKYGFPKHGTLLTRAQQHGHLTTDELESRLKSSGDFNERFFWALDPRRVRYIGDDEENMNKQIQQALNSDAFKQYKEETLNKIKALVKQKAQIQRS